MFVHILILSWFCELLKGVCACVWFINCLCCVCVFLRFVCGICDSQHVVVFLLSVFVFKIVCLIASARVLTGLGDVCEYSDFVWVL